MAPDVPTLREAGVSRRTDSGSWAGMFAPARTSPAILAGLADGVAQVMADPARIEGKPRYFISHWTENEILSIDHCSRRLVPKLQRANYRG